VEETDLRVRVETAPPERRALRLRRASAGEPQLADARDIREGQRTRTVLRRDTRMRRALGASDIAATCVALVAAAAVSDSALTPALFVAAVFIVPFCKLARLYDRDEHVIRKSTLDQAPALVQTATLYSLIAWFASGLFTTGTMTKLSVAVLWGVLSVALLTFRVATRRIALYGMTPERLLMLGSADEYARVGDRIAKAHSIRATLVGRVALERGDHAEPLPLAPIEDLDYLIRAKHVERVVIGANDHPAEEQLDTIRLVKALGVKVSVLPRLFEVVGSSMEFDDVDGITMLGLRRYGLPKSSWYVKRTFDLAVAGLAILVLAPVIAIFALAIRVTSPGPVLFRQIRVGRGGEPFVMFKFRTMYDGADDLKDELLEASEREGLFKLVDDPRVTPVGRFLRRTSLDELPQLFNVIRGDMSLVGPRPLIEEEDRQISGWQHRRRESTPGMTGVWQLLGSTRVPLHDMVKMDYLYRANWSLWLDVKVLLRTLAHVAWRRNA
jgi:exopolysaccharide biosynthesis polyprenyl glycosylphosphotransferase